MKVSFERIVSEKAIPGCIDLSCDGILAFPILGSKIYVLKLDNFEQNSDNRNKYSVPIDNFINVPQTNIYSKSMINEVIKDHYTQAIPFLCDSFRRDLTDIAIYGRLGSETSDEISHLSWLDVSNIRSVFNASCLLAITNGGNVFAWQEGSSSFSFHLGFNFRNEIQKFPNFIVCRHEIICSLAPWEWTVKMACWWTEIKEPMPSNGSVVNSISIGICCLGFSCLKANQMPALIIFPFGGSTNWEPMKFMPSYCSHKVTCFQSMKLSGATSSFLFFGYSNGKFDIMKIDVSDQSLQNIITSFDTGKYSVKSIAPIPDSQQNVKNGSRFLVQKLFSIVILNFCQRSDTESFFITIEHVYTSNISPLLYPVIRLADRHIMYYQDTNHFEVLSEDSGFDHTNKSDSSTVQNNHSKIVPYSLTSSENGFVIVVIYPCSDNEYKHPDSVIIRTFHPKFDVSVILASLISNVQRGYSSWEHKYILQHLKYINSPILNFSDDISDVLVNPLMLNFEDVLAFLVSLSVISEFCPDSQITLEGNQFTLGELSSLMIIAIELIVSKRQTCTTTSFDVGDLLFKILQNSNPQFSSFIRKSISISENLPLQEQSSGLTQEKWTISTNCDICFSNFSVTLSPLENCHQNLKFYCNNHHIQLICPATFEIIDIDCFSHCTYCGKVFSLKFVDTLPPWSKICPFCGEKLYNKSYSTFF